MDEIARMIGSRIRHLRELKGWTQEELSDRTAKIAKLEPSLQPLSRPYISSLENGQRKPSLGAIAVVARVFDVPQDMFLNDAGWVRDEESQYLPLQDIDHYLPEWAQHFIREQDSLAYIKLNIRMKDLQITPKIAEQIIDAIEAAKAVETGRNKS